MDRTGLLMPSHYFVASSHARAPTKPDRLTWLNLLMNLFFGWWASSCFSSIKNHVSASRLLRASTDVALK
jgi:hypothetical protein